MFIEWFVCNADTYKWPHSTSGKLDVSDSADDPDRSSAKNLRKALAVLRTS
jgi:hypothetical protein